MRTLFLYCFILFSGLCYSQECEDVVLSSVCFNMDACHSTFASSSQSDYSEFTGDLNNGANGSIYAVAGPGHIYRNNPTANTHSCTMGIDSIAMCVSSYDPCMFVDNHEKAIRFDIKVTPGSSGTGGISCLSFYEAAPEMFSWVNGSSGPNNYPQLYGIRVTKNGQEIFQQDSIPTTHDYTLESFNFSNNADFTVTQMTVFKFELLPYCTVGNGAMVNAWDIDEVKIYDKTPYVIEGGDISFSDGSSQSTVCESQNSLSLTLSNEIGDNSAWVVTDISGNIISVQGSQPLDISNLSEDIYFIRHLSYSAGIEGLVEGDNLSDLVGCWDLSNPITLLMKSNPIATVHSKSDTQCGDNDGNASASATGGSGSFSYEWSTGSTASSVNNLAAGTYSVTITDISGCSDVATVTIGSSSSPIATGSTVNTTCGDNNGSASVSATSGSGGYSYSWNNGSTSSTINNLSAGTYTVTVTDSEGCTDVEMMNVGSSSNPNVSITNVSDTTCGNNNGSATASSTSGSGGYSYAWSNGDTGVTIDNLSAGTYSVTVTDSAGCTDVTSTNIGSSTSPNVSANGTDTTCGDNNGSASASTTSGSGGYSYEWSNGGTGSTINNLSAGTYTVTVTDSAGCTDQDNVTIGASLSPVASINGTNTTCGEDNGSAVLSVSTATFPVTYLWSTGGTTTSINNLSSGTYTVTITDSDNCTIVESVTIGSSSNPVVSASGTDTTCGDDNGSATASTSNGSGANSYVWSNGETGSSISNLSAGTYTVTVTDSAGCTDEATTTIDSSSIPVASISGTDTTCGEDNGSAILTVTTATFPVTYLWSTGGTTTSIDDVSSGTYTVTITDSDNCTIVESVTIGSSSSPVASINGTNTTCGESNGSAILTVSTATFPVTYLWSTGGTTTSIDNVSAGTYTVTITDSDNCTIVESVTIGSSSNPVASISGTDTTCGEDNGSAILTVTTATFPVTYLWSTGGTTTSIDDVSSGTYTVTITDSDNCSIVESVTIGSSTSPNVSASSTDTTCGDDNGSATASTSSGSGGNSYAWSNGETGSMINNLSSGTYTVTVTDSEGCTDEASTTVGSSSNIQASISGTDTTCGEDNGSAILSVSTATFPVTYLWSTGGTTTSIDDVSAGTYTVTITDSDNCTIIESVTIGSSTSPNVSASSTDTTCGDDNGSATASTTSGSGGNSYAWSNGETGSMISNLSDGTYTVTVTDSEGCTDEASTTVDSSSNPEASISGTDTSCGEDNGSAVVSVSTATFPVTYLWSTGGTTTSIDDVSSGTYTVTITDSDNCTIVESVTIGSSTSPNVSASSTDTTCGDDNGSATASTTSGSGGNSYAWSNGETGSMINNLSSGTYTVTVTDSEGCTDEATTTVGSSSNIQASISGTNTTCGEDNGSAVLTVNTATFPVIYLWSTGGTTTSIDDVSSGTYTVTITDSDNCTIVESVTIGSSTSPNVSASSTDTTCGDDNGSATASTSSGSGGNSYAWSNGGTGSTINNLSAGTYTVTVTDSEGCTDESSTTVDSSSNLVASISGTDTTCGEDNGSAVVSVSTATFPVTYLWSTGGTTTSIDNVSSGTYTVTITDSDNCSIVESITIGSSTSPNVSASSTDTTCGDDNGSATASTSSGSGGNSYAWSNGETGSTISNLSDGTYTVTVTDSEGCTDEASTTVDSSSNPVASISGTDTTCAEDNGSAVVSVSTATFPVTYLWSTGGTTTSIDDVSSGTYTVTITDSDNCSIVETVTIGSSTSPNVSASSTDTTCGDDNGSATASTSSGSGGNSYAWSNGGTGSTISNLSSGTYTVTVTDSEGCTDEATTTVGSSSNIQASISGTDTTCGEDNGSAILSVSTATFPVTYLWSTGGTTTSIDNVSSGTYTVTITDSDNCSIVESVTIESSSKPEASISGTDTTCGEDNGSAVVSVSTATFPVTYLWSTGGTTTSIDNVSSGTYTVTITDSDNCSIVESVTIGSSTSPNVSVSNTDSTCGDNNGSATASTSSGSGGNSYAWSNGGTGSTISNLSAGTYTVTVTDSEGCTDEATTTVGSSSNIQSSISGTDTTCGEDNGSALVSVSTATFPVTYLWSTGGTTTSIDDVSAGTYTVTITDSDNCTIVESVTIGSSTSPNVSASSTDTTCGDDNGSVTASTSSGSGGNSYAWSNGETGSTINNLSSGTYSVTVTDSAGCTDVASANIGASTNPEVSVNGSDTSCGENNGSATASTTSGTGGYTYVWSNGSTSATINNLSSGTYSVTVTDSAGCKDAESVTIDSSNSPVITNLDVNDTTCGENNGSATVTVTSGSGGYTYSWSNGGNGNSISNLSAGSYAVTIIDSEDCSVTQSFTVGSSVVLSISISGTDEVCSNDEGLASVSVTNGTSPFTYNWSNGENSASINNLSSGTYSVTVTDAAGCTETTSININNDADLEIDASGTDTCCGLNNGEATVVISCYTDSYTVSWSNGETTETITDLGPGSYTVTVTDDAGESDTRTVVIGGSTSPNVTISHEDTFCGENNGSATATATQGLPGYTYEWSNGSTNSSIDDLAPGAYTVTVTDSKGCTDVEVVEIEDSLTPNAGNLNGGPFHFCVDGVPDYVTGVNLTGVVGTNTSFVITDAAGNILGLPQDLSQLEDVDFDAAGVGTCYIWHVSFDGSLTDLQMGGNANDFDGCYDISGPIEVNRDATATVNNTLSFDMNACQANGSFTEFTGDIVSYPGCTVFSVPGNNLTAGSSHSCTPGVSGEGMCFTAETGCAYDPNTAQKVIIPVGVAPGANGFGTLSGFSFYEQAPSTFVWTDGNSGPNNYPTKFAVRILKAGVVIFEETSINTNQSWTLAEYDFSGNADFTVSSPTTFTVELIPYCAVGNNNTNISIWDVDEIEFYSDCDYAPVGGTLNGGPYDVCIDNIPDFITDLSISGNVGLNNILITDEDGTILEKFSSINGLSNFDFNEGNPGTCYIWNVSFNSGFTGATIGNNVYDDLSGCYALSNSVAVVKTECGTLVSIFPNPATEKMTLRIGTPEFDLVSYQIVDNLGRVVLAKKIRNNLNREVQIDLRALTAGQYYLKSTVNGHRMIKPIIIVR